MADNDEKQKEDSSALDQDNESEDQEEGAEGEQPKSKINITWWLIYVGSPILLLIIVIISLYFFGVFGHSKPTTAEIDNSEAQPIEAQLKNVFYYKLPSLLVNLRSTGKRTNFLKLVLDLEVKGNKETEKVMQKLEPQIVDQFQTYLRELEIEDIQGSAGIQKLREALLERANAITHPIVVENILFLEFLVQ